MNPPPRVRIRTRPTPKHTGGVYLGSSASLEEKIRYGHPVTMDDLDAILDELKVDFEELKAERKENELLREQLAFARDVFDRIEEGLKDVKSGKQARAEFALALENGYFER